MAKDDQVIAEIREGREAHAAAHDFDIEKIANDLQDQEAESSSRVVTRPPREPVTSRG